MRLTEENLEGIAELIRAAHKGGLMRTGADISIGRMVHYTPGDRPHMTNAAIVSYVKNQDVGTVHLHVFPAGSSYPVSDVPYSEVQMPNTWRWPKHTHEQKS